MSPRPTRLLALSALLASAAMLPLPLAAAENPDGAAPRVAVAAPSTPDGTRLVLAENDSVADSDDDEDTTETAGMNGHDRWQRGSSDDEDQHDGAMNHGGGRDQGGDRSSQGGGRGWGHGGGDRQGWDNGSEDRAGPSRDQRRMMMMHGRMMQMMRGQGQGADFRIVMGNTRMAVRCSPRETMRECVDAALSLVNRLRDATPGGKSSGPDISPNPPALSGSGGTSGGTSGTGTSQQ